MKMSEVFKLPSWVGKFGDGHRGYHVCNGTGSIFAEGCTKEEAGAIHEAVDSHDTLTTELTEVVDALRAAREYLKYLSDGEAHIICITIDKIVAKHGSK